MNSTKNAFMAQSQSHTFAEENLSKERSSDDSIAYAEQFEDTPLWIRGDDNNGYFVTMGDKRISIPYETPGEAEEAIIRKDWNVLLNAMIGIFTNLQLLSNENINKTQTETMENHNTP